MKDKIRHRLRWLKLKFRKRPGLFFTLLVSLIIGYLIYVSLAAPTAPNVYLTPSAKTLPANTSFSIQVREISGSTAVNAVQANFTYPSNLVDFISIDATGSAFTTEAESNGGSGQVSIARGIIGSLTGDQLVATVNFKTKATSGAAAMTFVSGTALVSSSANQDILGSLSATTGGTYTVDTTPPAVSITAPTNGANLASGNTVSVSVSATDTGGVSSVDVYIDGAKKITLSASPYNYSWNTTGISLSSHTVQAKATDTTGNLGSSPTFTVSITDQTPPTIPGNFHSTSNTTGNISLAWNASTDNVGVSGYRLQRNGATITTTLGSTLSYTDTGLAANTSYSYTVAALDAAGNTSVIATLSSATLAPTAGDTNGDGHVNISDLSILLTNFGTSVSSCDFNHDGTINVFDLSILLSHYGA